MIGLLTNLFVPTHVGDGKLIRLCWALFFQLREPFLGERSLSKIQSRSTVGDLNWPRSDAGLDEWALKPENRWIDLGF